MSETTKSAQGQSGNRKPCADDAMVNDSLGTMTPADSTGTDESKETGDAKTHNANTCED